MSEGGTNGAMALQPVNRAVEVLQDRAFNLAAVREQMNAVQNLIKEIMRPGVDYGPIPGTGGKDEAPKNVLLLPGAQKLCALFRLVPRIVVETTKYEGDHREHVVRCQLISMASGQVVGEGLGSCSTMEAKYRWRHGNRQCPQCGKEALLRSRDRDEWFCWRKKDGCGAAFNVNDDRITSQVVGRVPNPDIADSWNTVLKIAKKRAMVDATLTATAAAQSFTQDIGDPEDEANASDGADDGLAKPAASQRPAPPVRERIAAKAEPHRSAPAASKFAAAAAERLIAPHGPYANLGHVYATIAERKPLGLSVAELRDSRDDAKIADAIAFLLEEHEPPAGDPPAP